MNTVYIFEDHKDDKLSVFFRSGFSADTVFKYSGGNGNLYGVTESWLDREIDLVVVFVDVVPNNYKTVEIFEELCTLAIDNMHRLIIIPTLGSEYYFIKSLKGKGIERYPGVLDVYCEVGNYVDKCDSFIKAIKVKPTKYSTFEQFGKRLIEHNFLPCIAKPKPGYRDYYLDDCECAYSKKSISHKCEYNKDLRSLDKVKETLLNYPFIPCGSLFTDCRAPITMDKVLNYIGKYLVCVRDQASDEFKLPQEQIKYYDNALNTFNEFRSEW